MKSRRFPMTIDEFQCLEWSLGWKYEYRDGYAHISPREAVMRCAMPVRRHATTHPVVALEPFVQADKDALIQSSVTAFRDGIEYCDWPVMKIREDAEATVEGFFAGRRGEPLAASRVLHGGNGSSRPLLGALLVVDTGENRALLDLLFLVPEYQRRGLATAMAESAVNALQDMGFETLESQYQLGNEASRAWHHRFGFLDRPDLQIARTLLAHARHELERQEREKPEKREDLSSLEAEVAFWEAEVQRLDAAEDECGSK